MFLEIFIKTYLDDVFLKFHSFLKLDSNYKNKRIICIFNSST